MRTSTSHHKSNSSNTPSGVELNSSVTPSGVELNSNYPITNNTNIIQGESGHSDINILRSTWFNTSSYQMIDKIPLSIEVKIENTSNPKQEKRRISF